MLALVDSALSGDCALRPFSVEFGHLSQSIRKTMKNSIYSVGMLTCGHMQFQVHNAFIFIGAVLGRPVRLSDAPFTGKGERYAESSQ